MRQAYRRASETMLQTIPETHRDDMMRREFRAAALGLVGFTDDEIKQLNLDALTADEFQELIREKVGFDRKSRGDSGRQLVVSPEEAKEYINRRG